MCLAAVQQVSQSSQQQASELRSNLTAALQQSSQQQASELRSNLTAALQQEANKLGLRLSRVEEQLTQETVAQAMLSTKVRLL